VQTITDEEQGHSLQSILVDSHLSVLKAARRRPIAFAATKPNTTLIAIAIATTNRRVASSVRRFAPYPIVGFPLASKLPSGFAPRPPPVLA